MFALAVGDTCDILKGGIGGETSEEGGLLRACKGGRVRDTVKGRKRTG